jgi:peptide deformylase
MAILPIVKYRKNTILSKKVQPVKEITPELIEFANDMIETLYAAPGIGLAANQVGKNISMLVIDITKDKKAPIVLFNPCITEKKGKLVSEEGCLSFPQGFTLEVPRAAKIKVKALNKQGQPIIIEAHDIFSRVLQHEIDHLEGKTMLDRLPLYKKLKYKILLKTKPVLRKPAN